MKEKINQINQSIEEKSSCLKEKAERYFTSITVPLDNSLQQRYIDNKSKSIPPISYILYGITGLSAIGLLASNSKCFFLCVAAASAFCGYKLSKRKPIHNGDISIHSQNSNLGSIKNEITSKVLESVKKITQEWEEFMELKQRELQSVISTSSIDDREKDTMLSKTYIYEVVDISMSEFSSMINKSANATEIGQKLSLYKEKVKSEVENAAHKQIIKYTSLTS